MSSPLARTSRAIARRWTAAASVLLLVAPGVTAADEFLDPAAAFKLSAQPQGDRRIELRFDVAPGYHLYRDRFAATMAAGAPHAGALQAPHGLAEFDTALDRRVEVFRAPVTLALPLDAAPARPFKLVVANQGCADAGLCYPPMERAFRVAPAAGALVLTALSEEEAKAWPAEGAAQTLAVADMPATTTSPAPAAVADAPGRFDAALHSHSLLNVAGVFLLAGLLLSFTPCVLPMIPILSSIIVGQGAPASRSRGFSLALAYSLGMALVYTALGMAAGLAGEGLAAALQNPWTLAAFALLLAGLALSMFGVYDLQMPSSLQSRMSILSGRLKGGQHAGVFAMGGLSALIVGPCVAAPLAGALVYISQTRDVVLGGTALFALASGMSVPLLLVGLSAGSLLPRAGGWMERVKHFFGVLLLAVALWMVSPVIPAWAPMLGAAALLLASAVYLGAFERLPEPATPRRALTKGMGLMLALGAAVQLVGVAAGGRDLMQPLQHLGANDGGPRSAVSARASPAFRTVTSVAALDEAVRAATRPVMVDFYADWCVACKEFETRTFSDDAIRQRLAALTLLRVDVTANSDDDKALMRRYQLFGPPALLFFPPAGAELAQARVIGFQDAETFRAQLDRLDVRVGMN